MNWLDGVLVAIIAISALISLVRGFVKEVLSLAVWIAAVWVSVRYTEALAVYAQPYIGSPTLRLIAAFASLFIATLLIGALVNYLAAVLVGRTGLTGTDRAVGVVFGGLRGVVIVALLVLLAGLTAVPREVWWQNSLLTTRLRPLVCRVGVEGWLADFDVRRPVVGDAVNPDGTPAARYWREYCAANPASSEDGAAK
jgi:membrane protein required for colicin V production